MNKKFKKLYDDLYIINDVCNCYLVLGEDKALLVDTGIGFIDLKKAVQAMTNKPLIVFNTHAHLDHFGSNYQFNEVLVHKDDKELGDFHNSKVCRKFFLESLPTPIRILLGKKIMRERPLNYRYVDENEIIDLGNRQFRILSTPGHTPGSSCLFDEKSGYFFGGDTIVPQGVLLNLDYSLPPQTLIQSMESLLPIQSKIQKVFPGHHREETDALWIEYYLDVAKKAMTEEGVIQGSKTGLSRIFQNEHVVLACKVHYE